VNSHCFVVFDLQNKNSFNWIVAGLPYSFFLSSTSFQVPRMAGGLACLTYVNIVVDFKVIFPTKIKIQISGTQ